jgi:hypothetical protein
MPESQKKVNTYRCGFSMRAAAGPTTPAPAVGLKGKDD